MDASNWIAFGAALIAISALIWQIRASNKQSQMQTYLTYTQRYQDILINLPVGVESDTFDLSDQEDRELILRWIRAYFDLCSEEFYLNENKMINSKVWKLWKGGMTDSLQKPAFKKAWKEIQKNNYYHHEFAGFIEEIILK